MHTSGPLSPRRKYFVYTGNTRWGVQNFEYDSYTGDYFLCVYKGQKPHFPNYPMFVIDGSLPPKEEVLLGYDSAEKGLILTLKETGLSENGIHGLDFEFGSTGFYSLGNGEYYVSEPFTNEDGDNATNVCLYRLKITDKGLKFVRFDDNVYHNKK
jgi:hypothetical protein